MKYLHCPDIEGFDALSLGLTGSAKMKIKLLTDDSAWIELAPEGHTPDHSHEDKERVVVMAGRGEFKVGEEKKGIKSSDFIELEPGEPHQFINTGNQKLSLICFRNQK